MGKNNISIIETRKKTKLGFCVIFRVSFAYPSRILQFFPSLKKVHNFYRVETEEYMPLWDSLQRSTPQVKNAGHEGWM